MSTGEHNDLSRLQTIFEMVSRSDDLGPLVNETFAMVGDESLRQSFETRTSKNPDLLAKENPQALLESALLLEKNSDYSLAKNIYLAMIKKGWMISQSYAGLARVFEKEDKITESLKCYEEAIAYAPDFEFFCGLAGLQVRIGKDEEAKQTLVHALGCPKLTEEQKFQLHKSLGNCFTRLNDYQKAEFHYRRAYDINPLSDALQVNVGSLCLQRGDLKTAIKHFLKAVEINPKNSRALNGLGMIEMEMGRFEQAHQYFVNCLSIEGSNLGAIYNLVKCAYELRQFDDAIRLLRNYISIQSTNTNILYSFAGLLYHKGEYAEAGVQVERILAINPNHAGAKDLLEFIQAR